MIDFSGKGYIDVDDVQQLAKEQQQQQQRSGDDVDDFEFGSTNVTSQQASKMINYASKANSSESSVGVMTTASQREGRSSRRRRSSRDARRDGKRRRGINEATTTAKEKPKSSRLDPESFYRFFSPPDP